MKSVITVWVVSFLSVFVPINTWLAYDIFLLSHCDPKFGCAGTFQLNLLIYGISAVISAIAMTLSIHFLFNRYRLVKTRSLLLVTTCVGVILSFLSTLFMQSSFWELPGSIAIWFVASFVFCLVAGYIQKNIARQFDPEGVKRRAAS